MTEETIFASALAKTNPAERSAYLDQACGGDTALRARVEALLRSAQEAGSFLDRPPAPEYATGLYESSGGGNGDGSRPLTEGPGTIIGRYKLLQQIGEGGMGVVYMAEQQEPVRRQVALKIIKPGMDSRQVIARFEAERQALALMDHLHIARVLDAGATATGRPYFVMELVKGIPITQFCDQNQLTPRERLELFVPVCQAIQHAHQKGIIHRDIKPGNVLVTLYDGKPVPKVIDFGIAKAIDQRLTEKTMFTRFGQVVGTLEYMSPEQAEMSDLDIDTRSDVYGLGVLLYELLTGSTPIDRQRLRQAAFAEALRLIREEEPARPSTRLSDSGEALPSISAQRKTEPKKLGAILRGELDWIVMKALEKDRMRRYETANGLAADVRRYLADEAVEAGPPSAAYKLRKFARKHRGLFGATAVLAILLVLGLLVSTWFALVAARMRMMAMAEMERAMQAEQEARAERDRAVQEKQRADKEAAIAQAVTDFLRKDLLSQADIREQAKGQHPPTPDLQVRQVLDRAAARIGDIFADQPITEAAIRSTIGNAYVSLGEYTKAETHLRRALELRRKHLGPEHPETRAAQNDLASVLQLEGKLAEAEALSRQSLKAPKRQPAADSPETISALERLGSALQAQGKLAEAEVVFRQVLESRRKALGADHPDTLNTTHQLGLLLLEEGKPAEAEAVLRQNLEASRKRLGAEHPQTLAAVDSLARVYLAQKKLAEAAALLQPNLETRHRVLGADHPQTLASKEALAEVFRAQNRLAEAAALLQPSLEARRRLLGPQHPDTLKAASSLARVLQAQGRLAEAEAMLLSTYEARTKVAGPQSPQVREAVESLVKLYEAWGKPEKAAAWKVKLPKPAKATEKPGSE